MSAPSDRPPERASPASKEKVKGERKRDAQLIALEEHLRQAVRDAVNRPSRKPFHWGGLAGYRQLEALARVLDRVRKEGAHPETTYLRRLATQVKRAVETTRPIAEDVAQAHQWLRRIATCLHYPPKPSPPSETAGAAAGSSAILSSASVRQAMEERLAQLQPQIKCQPAQTALYDTWQRLWYSMGDDLLHCYDIPGLPPDNLKMEAHFGQLRNHQRRISGRASTRPLRDFGLYQVLFLADSEVELLDQLRQVPLTDYKIHRHRLAEAEAERQWLRRLHHDPVATARQLIQQHRARRATLARAAVGPP